MKQVQVEYVGAKDQETDHLYGTGITWVGRGDVHTVPATAWDGMKKHPDVWRLVEEGETQPASIQGLSKVTAPKAEADKTVQQDQPHEKKDHVQHADGLDALSLDQLRELCTARGIYFHANAKEANLIAKLRA